MAKYTATVWHSNCNNSVDDCATCACAYIHTVDVTRYNLTTNIVPVGSGFVAYVAYTAEA